MFLRRLQIGSVCFGTVVVGAACHGWSGSLVDVGVGGVGIGATSCIRVVAVGLALQWVWSSFDLLALILSMMKLIEM